MNLLGDLNDRQREAVLSTEGPVLIIAGAGTGKTRVITYRVAYLISKGIPGNSILAVTFTNKAADVMKERIRRLLSVTGHDASEVWISTFHSFCARLLRRDGRHLGLAQDFAIYDDDDQTAAVKRALDQLGLADRGFPARGLREQISQAKNYGTSSDAMEAGAGDDVGKQVAAVFRAYEEILRKSSALDFDDLLLRGAELLKTKPCVRELWNERFRYVLVDEFQDTNSAQEELVRLLAGTHKNVCVVGDEDQSIYGWRGARAGNLKRFTEDFPSAKLIRLEENYRSTQTILDAAAAVVAHNTSRLGKELRATLGQGTRLRFFEAQDALSEANFICGEVAALVQADPDARVAVLYRTTAQSRTFEEVMRRLGVRYRVVGGFSFYQRDEVKNALAYIRVLFHPEDDVAVRRILNVPPRGIGATTLAGLEASAKETQRSLWAVIGSENLPSGNQRSAKWPRSALMAFRKLIEDLQKETKDLPPAQLIERVLDRTGYLDWVEQQDNLEHTSRAENLRELANAMIEAAEQGQTLLGLLDQAALASDADEFDESIPVSLMTLHSAKGLEFDAVYLAGLEEGLLPHSRSLSSLPEIEEERRLCYVGMTRAKQSLVVSRAVYRRLYGEERLRASLPSRFLTEIPGELIEAASGSLAEPGETRRYESDDGAYSAYSRGRRGPAYGRVSSTARAAPSPLIGTRVRHPKYGVGTITAVEGEGEDRRLIVSFLDYGPKKLLERYAHLELA